MEVVPLETMGRGVSGSAELFSGVPKGVIRKGFEIGTRLVILSLFHVTSQAFDTGISDALRHLRYMAKCSEREHQSDTPLQVAYSFEARSRERGLRFRRIVAPPLVAIDFVAVLCCCAASGVARAPRAWKPPRSSGG